MNITTLFDLGDVVYPIVDADKGNLIPLIVEKIIVNVETLELTAIKYQVSATAKFHNSIYFENELELHEDAKERAENELNDQITQIQQEISDL